MTATLEDIKAHYVKTIGAFKLAFPDVKTRRLGLSLNTVRNYIDVDIYVHVPPHLKYDFRDCIRAYFKKYIKKPDVIRCWLSGHSKKIHIMAEIADSSSIFNETVFVNKELKTAIEIAVEDFDTF